MLARDVMTTTVATVHPRTPLAEAVAKLVEGRISGLPVVDDQGALVGILTEGDLLRRVELGTVPQHSGWMRFLRGPGLAASEYVRTHTAAVEDVMTQAPTSATPATTLDDVVALMERHRVRRVPIVDDGKLVGLVSRADLVRALASALHQAAPAPATDAAIKEAIMAELNSQAWSNMCSVTVAVQNGQVRLEGIAQSEAVHRALRVAAETVAGAKNVVNAVSILDPMVTAIGA